MKNILFLICLMLTPVTYADTVSLHDGPKIEGTVFAQDAGAVQTEGPSKIQRALDNAEIEGIRGRPINEDMTVAIILGDNPDSVLTPYLAILEVGLSKARGIRLLERAQIDKVLQEHEFAYGGMTKTRDASPVGHLLKADVLLFCETIPALDLPIYRLRVVESSTGLILHTFLVDDETVFHDLEKIQQAIQKVKEILKIPLKERRFIGLMGIQSEEPGSSLDSSAQALTMFLNSDLARAPDIIVLDREHMDDLQKEALLTDMEQDLKASTYLLEGGMRRGNTKETWSITLNIRPMGSEAVETIAFQLPADNMAEARTQLREKVLMQLNIKLTNIKPQDPKKEARSFLNKVPVFLSSGNFKEAVSHAEVAVALDESPEALYYAARAWQAYGWDMANNFNANDWVPEDRSVANMLSVEESRRYPNTPNVRRTTSRSQDIFWGPAAPQDLKGQRHLIKEKKIRALSALMRSYDYNYKLIHQYISDNADVSCAEYGWEDPLRHQVKTTLPKYIRHDHKAVAEVFNKNDDVLRLYFQVIEYMDRILNLKMSGYEKCYGSSEEIRRKFWDTMQDKRELINDYYTGSETYLIPYYDFVRDYVDRLENPFRDEVGMQGFWDAVKPFRYYNLLDVDRRFITDLAAHKEPFVALLANFFLMKAEEQPPNTRVRRIDRDTFNRGNRRTEAVPEERAEPNHTRDIYVKKMKEIMGQLDKTNFFRSAPHIKERLEGGMMRRRVSGITATEFAPGQTTKVIRVGQGPTHYPARSWANQEIVSTGVRIISNGFSRGAMGMKLYGEGAHIAKNILIEDTTLYIVGENLARTKTLKLTLHIYSLENGSHRVFPFVVLEAPHQDAAYVTGLQVSPEYIYVSTFAGIFRFNKREGALVSNDFWQGRQGGAAVSKAVHLGAKDGLPDDHITSFKVVEGKYYVGTGPVIGASVKDRRGSAFFLFDPQTKEHKLIASSLSVHPKNGLDGGLSYRIIDILHDQKRHCLWLAVAGHKERSGIWKYDLESKKLSHVVKETHSVKKMIFNGEALVYLLHQSGLVEFNPDQNQKQWLIGYTNAIGDHPDEGPFPPEGLGEPPLNGHPETELWPFGVLGKSIFAIHRERSRLERYTDGLALEMPFSLAETMGLERIQHITSTKEKLYLINRIGDVYFVR